MCKGQEGRDVSLLEVKTLSLKMWPDGLHVLVTSRHSHLRQIGWLTESVTVNKLFIRSWVSW